LAYFPIPFEVRQRTQALIERTQPNKNCRANKNRILFTSSFDKGKTSKLCHFFFHLLIPLTSFIMSLVYVHVGLVTW